MDPRAVLDAGGKRKIPSPRRESNPRTPIVQSVAQRYTNRAITALGQQISNRFFFFFFCPRNYRSGWILEIKTCHEVHGGGGQYELKKGGPGYAVPGAVTLCLTSDDKVN
jgi:hypothetical protein